MELYSVSNIAVGIFVVIVALNVRIVKQKTKGEWSLIVLTLLVSFTFIFVWFPLVLSLPILWLYRQIVRCYLKIKHGSSFVGLIEGADVINICNKTENSLLSVLLIFECSDEQRPQDFYENFKNVMDKYLIQNRDKLTKYHSAIKSCLGYLYMLKQNVTIDDCVKKMETVNNKNDELSKAELIRLLAKCNKEPLPKDNSILWDIYVGTQPVNWKSEAQVNVKYYPALYRLHHGIADGFDFVQLFAGVISDKSPGNSKEEYCYKSAEYFRWTVHLDYFVAFMYSFVFNTSLLLLENGLIEKEHNILHGPELSNSDIYAIKIDNGTYFRKIKDMKNKLPGTLFSDIILTAISASISEYFQKHSPEQPERLKVVLPYLRKAMLLPQIPVGQLTLSEISCHNSYSHLTVDFPLCIENNNIIDENSALLQRLLAVKKETRMSYNSVENRVAYFWSHVAMQIFPFPIVKNMYDMMEWTMAFSTLPGPPKLVLGDGKLPICDVLFWIPHMAKIGCNFSIITYDNRLQLGLNIDRTLISNQEHAQSILDGIFKYLDLLENAIGTQK